MSSGGHGLSNAVDRFGGLRIIKDPNLTIGPFEDWSRVRSPGRARRRRMRYRQNIRLYYLPNPDMFRMGDMLVGHPATIAKLVDRLRNAP